MDKINLSNIKNRALVSLIMGIIIMGAVLFLLAWTFNYWQAWIYLAIFSSSSIIITFYFLRHDPKLVERRLKAGPPAEKEKSQKVIQSFSIMFVIILVLISLLDHRFHWSIVPWFLVVISDVFIVSGFVLLLTLSKNLPGYIEYCQRTRYRLIPLIW